MGVLKRPTSFFYKVVGTGFGFDETIFGFIKPTIPKPEPVSLKQISPGSMFVKGWPIECNKTGLTALSVISHKATHGDI